MPSYSLTKGDRTGITVFEFQQCNAYNTVNYFDNAMHRLCGSNFTAGLH